MTDGHQDTKAVAQLRVIYNDACEHLRWTRKVLAKAEEVAKQAQDDLMDAIREAEKGDE